MLSWICPECGRECSPVDRTCPACAGPGPLLLPVYTPPLLLTEARPFEPELQCWQPLVQAEPICTLFAMPLSPVTPLAQASSLALPGIPVPLFGPFVVHPEVPAAARRFSMPPWAITVFVLMAFTLGVASMGQKVASHPGPVSAPPPISIAAHAEPLPTEPPEPEHPMARFMEVTGLRVVADAGDQAQVQYTVVNHSTFDLSDIALRVSVGSAAGAKAPPLFTVTARVSRLGPRESKEIRTGLDSQLKPSQIPGWEHLRTEVKILPAQ